MAGVTAGALRYRSGQALALFVLSALAIAACAFGPMYERAVEQAQLNRTLTNTPIAGRGISASAVSVRGAATLGRFLPRGDLDRYYGPPVTSVQLAVQITADGKTVEGNIANRAGQCAHLRLVAGRCATGAGEGVASSTAAKALKLTVGDRVPFGVVLPHETRPRPAGALTVVGLYQPFDPHDDYWFDRRYSSAAGLSVDPQTLGVVVDTVFTTAGFPPRIAAELKHRDRHADVSQLGDVTETDRALRVSRVHVDDMATLRDGTAALVASARHDGAVTVDTSVAAALDKVDRGREAAARVVPVFAAEVALLVLVVIGIVVASAAEQRRAEFALARLRGRGAGRTARLLDVEFGVVVLASAVPGVLVAWAGGLLACRWWLSGAARPELRWPVLAAAGAVLVAVALVVAVVARRSAREPVHDLLRRVPRLTSRLRLGMGEATLATAAIAGIAVTLAGDRRSALAVVTPGLTAVLAGLVLSRVLAWVAGIVGRWAFWRGLATPGLALLQIARRPATRSVVVVICVATALIVSAADQRRVAARNRSVRAGVQAGAAVTLTVRAASVHTLRSAVAAADPTGGYATPVVTQRPPNGPPVVAVDPQSFRRIAAWGWSADLPGPGQLSALTPPHPPPIMLTGTAARMRLADVAISRTGTSRATRAPPVYLGLDLRHADGSESVARLGPLPGGYGRAATLSAAVPCASGCRLAKLSLLRSAQDAGELDVTVRLAGLAVGAPGAQRRVALGPASEWASVGQAPQYMDLQLVGGALILTIRDHGGTAAVQHLDVPLSVPALVAGAGAVQRDENGGITGNRLDGIATSYLPAGTLSVLPGARGSALLVDLRTAAASATPSLAGSTTSVWLSKNDRGRERALVASLAGHGVRVLHRDTLAAHRSALDASAPAWAMRLASVSAVLAGLIAALVILIAAGAARRTRSDDTSVLALVGTRRATLRRAAVLEQASVVLAGAALGVVVGVVGANLALPAVPIFLDHVSAPAIMLPTEWGSVGVATLVTALVLLAVGVLAARILVRHLAPDGPRAARGARRAARRAAPSRVEAVSPARRDSPPAPGKPDSARRTRLPVGQPLGTRPTGGSGRATRRRGAPAARRRTRWAGRRASIRAVAAALRHRWGQVAVLVVLSALAIAACAFGPLYERAVEQAQLKRTLADTSIVDRGLSAREVSLTGGANLAPYLPAGQLSHYYKPPVTSVLLDVTYRVASGLVAGSVGSRTDLCAHLDVVAGRCVRGPGEVVASTSAARTLGLSVRDRIRIDVTAGLNAFAAGRLRIVGLYEPPDQHDDYWFDHRFSSAAGAQLAPSSVSPGAPVYVNADTLFATDGFEERILRRAQHLDPHAGLDLSVLRPVTQSDVALRADRVTLDDMATLRAGVAGLVAFAGKSGGDVDVHTNIGLALEKVDRGRQAARRVIPVFAAEVGLLVLVVIGIVVVAAADQRRAEFALARLRGRGAGRGARALDVEFGLVVLASAVPGLVLAWLGAVVACRFWLSGSAGPELRWAVMAAAGGVVVAEVVLVALVGRTTARRPIHDLLRRVPRRRARLGLGVGEAVLAVAALGGVVVTLSGDRRNVLAVVMPGLLAVLAGLVLARVLAWLARVTGQRALWRGRATAGLALLQIARRPAVRSVVVLMCMATALIVSAADQWQVAARNRTVRAGVQAGAAVVLTVRADSVPALRAAVAAADPAHHYATPVVTYSGFGATVMAVDPAFRRIAAWGWREDHPGARLFSRLAPRRPPPITITGSRVRLSLGDVDFRRHKPPGGVGRSRPMYLLLHLVEPDGTPSGVRLGPIPEGRTRSAVLSAPMPCTRGCRLATISLLRATVDADRVSITATVRGFAAGRPGAMRPVALGRASDWGDATGGSGHAGFQGSGTTLSLSMDDDGGVATAQHLDVPLVVPALARGVGPNRDSNGDLTESGIDGQVLSYDPVGSLSLLPGVRGPALLVDLDTAAAAATQPTGDATTAVWLGRNDPSRERALVSSLAGHGVRVSHRDTLAAHRAGLAKSAPAWAMQVALAAALLAVLMAAIVVLISASAARRTWTYDMSALELVGVDRAILRRAAVLEQASAAVAGVAAGGVVGVIGAQLALPAIPLFLVHAAVPAVLRHTAWTSVWVAAALTLAALVAAGVAAALVLLRQVTPERVRGAAP